jgi:hypothetical protein
VLSFFFFLLFVLKSEPDWKGLHHGAGLERFTPWSRIGKVYNMEPDWKGLHHGAGLERFAPWSRIGKVYTMEPDWKGLHHGAGMERFAPWNLTSLTDSETFFFLLFFLRSSSENGDINPLHTKPMRVPQGFFKKDDGSRMMILEPY